jgi:hypothetical protein
MIKSCKGWIISLSDGCALDLSDGWALDLSDGGALGLSDPPRYSWNIVESVVKLHQINKNKQHFPPIVSQGSSFKCRTV